ncbi:MAG: hypothetical protein ACI9GM_001027 [Salibacteraceae bacterium]|jgi:hypothetical protein
MKKIITIIIGVVFLISCERDTDNLGPNLSDIYGDFQVFGDFESNTKNVDFSIGESVGFTARFNKTVDWEVRIVGQKSGATKILTGKSKTLDEINANWDGSTTTLPMFKNESCNAYLALVEEGYNDTILGIVVDSTRFNEGFVVADFESGVNPGWEVFKQSGGDMSFSIVQNDSAAEKSNYYDLGGEVNFDYLIGYIYFPASAYGLPAFPLSPVPSNVYFNVMLGKSEVINNEIILFQFLEDENGDGVFQPGSEDMYSIELKSINADWETISVKYSDLVALVNGAPAAPNGNGIHEPDKLMQVNTLFLADPASGYSQTFMDYIIFTENEALQP